MFSVDLKNTFFQKPIHPDSQLYLLIALNESHVVQGFVLWPFHSTLGLHQSFLWFWSELTGEEFLCFATWTTGR